MPAIMQAEVVDSLALLSLKCASRVFDVSSRLAHVSMRDQIVRAQLLARDLPRFDVDCRRVLVVGAGVAGMTFAIEAAASGLDVVIAEAGKTPLALQSSVTTRYVGPFMYEWPSAFHDDQAYPPDAARYLGSPSEYTPNWGSSEPILASEMAQQYQEWLRQARRRLGSKGPALWFDVDRSEVKAFVLLFTDAAAENLSQWMSGAPLRPMPSLGFSRGRADADNPPGTSALTNFTPDYIVLAVGMGQENTALPATSVGGPQVSGRRFWENDDLRQPVAADLRVGVFGGGDGALQDVLRLLTKFEHPLELIAFLRGDPDVANILDKERDALLAIEQQSRLIGTWTLGSAVFAEVDQACRDLAERLAAKPVLRTKLALGMRPGRGWVRHFVRDEHFGKAYLLNRFAVHLIRLSRAEAAKSEGEWAGFVGYQLYLGAEALAAATESGGASSENCEVSVRLRDKTETSFPFDRVVVRLGIDKQAVEASQMIQLSPRDNGLRTAISQVPMPFVMSASKP